MVQAEMVALLLRLLPFSLSPGKANLKQLILPKMLRNTL